MNYYSIRYTNQQGQPCLDFTLAQDYKEAYTIADKKYGKINVISCRWIRHLTDEETNAIRNHLQIDTTPNKGRNQ